LKESKNILYGQTYCIDLIKKFDKFRIYESIEFVINFGMLLHKKDKLFSVHEVYRGTAKLRKGYLIFVYKRLNNSVWACGR
jgi:hypothetical protein